MVIYFRLKYSSHGDHMKKVGHSKNKTAIIIQLHSRVVVIFVSSNVLLPFGSKLKILYNSNLNI